MAANTVVKTNETVEEIEYKPVEESALTSKDSKHEIVSLVAYLIGVNKSLFEGDRNPLKFEIYNQLDNDKNARIIRHLCIVRTHIWRNYKHISNKIRIEHRDIRLMTEHIPKESLDQLRTDGIDFAKKTSTKVYQHIIEINRIISDRINNCKVLFPLWLKWEYIRELFMVPDGYTEYGTKVAADTYYEKYMEYPYQMYINFAPSDEGNILYSDKRFVTLLYRWHNEEFTEYSKVTDASSHVKGNIYDYIYDSDKIVVLVDCENSDPYKLCATLNNLDNEYMQKISTIILVDDVHASTAWRIMERFTSIPVKHLMIERVKGDKSLVDISLTAEACREHYQNRVDSFIIVSSDSDYWGLISSLSEARFLIMVEHGKCGPDMKNALSNNGIFYCFIDDFYTGNATDLQKSALFTEMYRYLDKAVNINVIDMFDNAMKAARVTMTDAEKNRFIDKYLKTMQLTIADTGDVLLSFKHKREY